MQPLESYSQQPQISDPEELQKLEAMLVLCRYSCAAVQLERGFLKIFSALENKFLLQKIRVLLVLREQNDNMKVCQLRHAVENKLRGMCRVLEVKLFNHKAHSLMSISQYSRTTRKLKKYEQLEKMPELEDPDYATKTKQLEQLSRRYNRLLSEFSLFTQKSYSVLRK